MTTQISGSMVGFIWYVLAATLAGSLVGTALEILIPGEKQSWASRLRALPIWAAYILIGLAVSAAVQFSLKALGLRPWVVLDLRHAHGPKGLLEAALVYAALPLAGFLAYDFLYYWFHRLLHRFGLLWRVHAVHHSLEELNAVNDYHHWAEDALRVPLILVPISLLVSVDATVLLVCIIGLRFMGQMTHANSRVSYGVFRYVLAEPRFHRVHHSLERRHFDKNFAFMFPLWDLVFGTAYFPAYDEYPKTGLTHQAEPRSVRDYVTAPFRRARPAAAGSDEPAPAAPGPWVDAADASTPNSKHAV